MKMKSLCASPLLQLLLVALVGLLAYSNSFGVPFVFDDESSIVANEVIRDLGSFLSGAGYSYNPRRFLGYLTLALNYRLGGLNVAGYHQFNLVVHVAAASLVWGLARLTLRTPYFEKGSDGAYPAGATRSWAAWLPLIAALLFVSHPVQTQAVTYIVQRFASLATFFFLLALLLYARARLCDRPCTTFPLVLYLCSLLAALAAMKTKEIAFTLPAVLLLYELLFFQSSARRRLLLAVPALLLLVIPVSLAGSGAGVTARLSQLADLTRVQSDLPRLDYLFTQFRVVVTYLRLLILPVQQNLDYDYPVYRSFFAPQVLLSFLLLLALFLLSLYLLYRSPRQGSAPQQGRGERAASQAPPETRLISFGLLWFFVTLSVESSVIPIADVIFEHRLYLPSVGAFLAASATAVLVLGNSRRRLALSAALVVLVLAGATFSRNRVWCDAVTLNRDIVSKSPALARAHYNLALALDDAGRGAEAFREAETAARLDPEAPKPHNLMGSILAAGGRYREAIAELNQALRFDPEAAYLHANLASLHLATGATQPALEHLLTARRLAAQHPEFRERIDAVCRTLYPRLRGELKAASAAMPYSTPADNGKRTDPTH